jgi:hypothetical protein
VRVSVLCILLGGAPLLIAQEPSAPTADQAAIDQATPQPSATAPSEEREGRIFGIIPNNKTVPHQKTAAQAVTPLEEPLTVRKKFDLAFKDTTDPFTVVLAAFYAGVAQWQNDFPTYGQGSVGFAKRFGAAYADQGIGNYLTEAIFPVVFHEDPRYFRKGVGSGRRRLMYALSRVVITRTDRGKDHFNYSEFVGNGAAAGLSCLYYPASERTASETAQRFAVQIVSDGAFNILLEFWPDMKREFLKKKW